jgi:hypothetical protein
MRKGKRKLLVVAMITAFIAMGLVLPGLASAGELEPPAGAVDASGKPVPTMHTLDEIYHLIDEICQSSVAAGVPRTGQTTSYATGDDGDLQKGLAWPYRRFTDNLDGTVTDNLTGLIWLKNADYLAATKTWADALIACNTLADDGTELTDRSSAGDWRLPNIRELLSLVDYSRYNPALPSGHPFSDVQLGVYWSSTTEAIDMNQAWSVNLNVGSVNHELKPFTYSVWPVRGGQ